MTKTILLTGASGFIGQRLLSTLQDQYQVQVVSLQNTPVAEIDFEGVDAVIHLAGKAHQMVPIPDAVYFEVNTGLTLQFAEAAKKAGVKHFVFASTIKVYGDNTASEVITLDTPCAPDDAYGRSKYEAEQGLLALDSPAFGISILRLPLVYGAGVKGNLWKLLQLTDSPYPLPFKQIDNRRSMVYIGNVVAFIQKIVELKATGIFLPVDAPDLSTSAIITLMRTAMQRPVRLFRVSPFLLRLGYRLKPALMVRLFGSMVVDGRSSYHQVGFLAPFSAEYGIREMVGWYQKIK